MFFIDIESLMSREFSGELKSMERRKYGQRYFGKYEMTESMFIFIVEE